MTSKMSSKQEKLAEDAAGVGERLTRAKKPRPKRQTFAALTAVEEPTETTVEVVAEAVDVLTSTAEPAQPPAEQDDSDAARVPSWKTLCQPPARRGTTPNYRRFAITCPEATLQRLTELDELQVRARGYKVNRNLLVETAIATYAANQAYWVQQWEQAGTTPVGNTALQGRVPESAIAIVKELRFYTDDTGRRNVYSGPILTLIVNRILAN